MIGVLASYHGALRFGRDPKLGLRVRVLALLQERAPERVSTTEIWQALGADQTCVRNCMARLRREGDVRCERVGNGFAYWVRP